jgi:hypothetical protein
MSFWGFFCGFFTRVLERSLEAAHLVHLANVFVTAILLVLSLYSGAHAVHEGSEPMTALAFLAAAFLVFLWAWIWYAYLRCREEYDRRVRAEARLAPVLEIQGVEPVRPGDDHRRVVVRNRSSGRLRFRARLAEIRSSPSVEYSLPVPLAPTHAPSPHAEAEVEGDGQQLIDVFVDPGPPQAIGLLLAGSPPVPLPVPRDRRYELRICVYPAVDGAVSTYRWFYIVPQPGGGIVFTADGAGEVANQAAPTAG